MYYYTIELLKSLGFSNNLDTAALLLSILAGLLAYIAVRFIIRFTIASFFRKLSTRKEYPWMGVLIKNKVLSKASTLTIPIIISIFSSDVAQEHVAWGIVVKLSLIVTVLYVLHSLVRSANDIYELRDISKNVPLRGLLQIIEIIFFLIGGILTISVILQMNPSALLGSLGAMTAITTLIFKDAILGFVAGIQLSAIDMVRIGDVIEMPQHSVFGTVIEISLTTVKVEEFDKTIVSVPAYNLVSETFINRRGILAAGMRRIKRSFNIDATGVGICDRVMVEKFKSAAFLADYIEKRMPEIENGRPMTNIEVFRAYIAAYLKNHSSINQEAMLMVRQLEAHDKGIPIEVYAFVNTTDWAEFESIQSDIFDHIYAVIHEFDLSLYQNLSSSSARRIL